MLLRAVCIVSLFVLFSGCGAREPSEGGQETMAFVMCQKPITNLLRSPSTAKFSYLGTTEASSIHLGGGTYFVNGHVDSQNGFGAMTRSKWTCTIKENQDKTWSALEFDIN